MEHVSAGFVSDAKEVLTVKASVLYKWLTYSAIVISVLLCLFMLQAGLKGNFRSVDTFQSYIRSFGIFAPFIFVFIQAFQVVIPVLPGFIDGHSHFSGLAMSLGQCDLSSAKNFEDIIRLMQAFMKENGIPDGEWVTGTNYDHNYLQEKRHPDKFVLDQISDRHPVVIIHASSHMGVANSMGLKRQNLDESTQNPNGGRYGRLENSTQLNGYMEESAFVRFRNAMPIPDMNSIMELFKKAQRIYAGYGITTVQEGMVTPPLLQLLRHAQQKGIFYLDIVGYLDAESCLDMLTSGDAVAKEYGCELIEVLTGFKWIGQQVLKNEKTGHGTYLFGMEESYGCLIGTYARDKDAISATAALCEAAAYYKQKGMTLWDAMVAMYDKYGYYKDAVKSIGLSGIEGLAKIQSIMETLRNNTPAQVGSYNVVSARDYKLDTIKDMATGEVKPTGLPSSNVLYYDLNDGAWICVRPSGTEPKIKFYYGIKGSSMEDADAKAESLGAAVMAMVDKMM